MLPLAQEFRLNNTLTVRVVLTHTFCSPRLWQPLPLAHYALINGKDVAHAHSTAAQNAITNMCFKPTTATNHALPVLTLWQAVFGVEVLLIASSTKMEVVEGSPVVDSETILRRVHWHEGCNHPFTQVGVSPHIVWISNVISCVLHHIL